MLTAVASSLTGVSVTAVLIDSSVAVSAFAAAAANAGVGLGMAARSLRTRVDPDAHLELIARSLTSHSHSELLGRLPLMSRGCAS
jgi:hypothetical protein